MNIYIPKAFGGPMPPVQILNFWKVEVDGNGNNCGVNAGMQSLGDALCKARSSEVVQGGVNTADCSGNGYAAGWW